MTHSELPETPTRRRRALVYFEQSGRLAVSRIQQDSRSTEAPIARELIVASHLSFTGRSTSSWCEKNYTSGRSWSVWERSPVCLLPNTFRPWVGSGVVAVEGAAEASAAGAAEAGAVVGAEAAVVAAAVVGQAGVVAESSDASSNASHVDAMGPKVLIAVRRLPLIVDVGRQRSLTADAVEVRMGRVVMPQVAMPIRKTVNPTIQTSRRHRVGRFQALAMLQEGLVTVQILMGLHQQRFRNRTRPERRYQCLLLRTIQSLPRRHRLQHRRHRFQDAIQMKRASGRLLCRATTTIQTRQASSSMFQNKPRCMSMTGQ